MTIERSKLSNKLVYASIACWLLSLALPTGESAWGYQIFFGGLYSVVNPLAIFLFPIQSLAFCTNFIYFFAVYKFFKGKKSSVGVIVGSVLYNIAVVSFSGFFGWNKSPDLTIFTYAGINLWLLSFVLMAIALFFRRKL